MTAVREAQMIIFFKGGQNTLLTKLFISIIPTSSYHSFFVVQKRGKFAMLSDSNLCMAAT